MKFTKRTILFPLMTIILFSCKPIDIKEVRFIQHKLDFELLVDIQNAEFVDAGTFDIYEGKNLFYISPNAVISSLQIDGNQTTFQTFDSTSAFDLSKAFGAAITQLNPPSEALWIVFEAKQSREAIFKIHYSSIFNDAIDGATFSSQNIGREVTGTINEKGAYLSPSSYYYPQGNDGLMTFEVTATLPPNWESIADGNSVATIKTATTKIQSWRNPYQSDGLMFMAAPFVVKHAKANEIDVYCYFFAEDTSLFETYLPATVDYLNMYSETIGPYPFERFSVAENFFPTGYGMPAWTLLGQRVIRMPFIVMTSLGHEVLHNWWGNSIYVDYSNGNWCEGLTVYGADYAYKLQHGKSSARDYRKNILKDYKNYVTEENEFPVREFISRHNAESRTIGYNKTMMIFHMIEDKIGHDAFINSQRAIYQNHRGEKVTWEQWLSAFSENADEDLSNIIPEWIDRKGAANIHVEPLSSIEENGETTVKFKVFQDGDVMYHLRIPIRFIGSENHDVLVELFKKEAIYTFTFKGTIQSYELDPDYDLFRHLYPEEIEPTVSAVLGASEKQFFYASASDSNAIKSFGDNLTESDTKPLLMASQTAWNEGAAIVLNPSIIPDYLLQHVSIEQDFIRVDGQEYPRKGHTFVLSADAKTAKTKLLVIISDDPNSLGRLGQLVPHYGKYSYLIFDGSRNIDKGQWPALESPLRVNL
jgi:aminopeptidase N